MTPEDASQPREGDTAGAAAGWSTALPEKIPPPTYAPAFLALGITFLLFGVVSCTYFRRRAWF